MSEKTVMHNKLTRLIEAIGNYECPGIGSADIPVSHIEPFLLEVQHRLDRLETGLLKMQSALDTNPVTGDKTVQAVLKTLLDGRR